MMTYCQNEAMCVSGKFLNSSFCLCTYEAFRIKVNKVPKHYSEIFRGNVNGFVCLSLRIIED